MSLADRLSIGLNLPKRMHMIIVEGFVNSTTTIHELPHRVSVRDVCGNTKQIFAVGLWTEESQNHLRFYEFDV